ncbi:hypothetical protein L1887_20440 [Cichorium endivia]|nr:hypothetical protein L1887_20440 [Cichorium endivia]
MERDSLLPELFAIDYGVYTDLDFLLYVLSGWENDNGFMVLNCGWKNGDGVLILMIQDIFQLQKLIGFEAEVRELMGTENVNITDEVTIESKVDLLQNLAESYPYSKSPSMKKPLVSNLHFGLFLAYQPRGANSEQSKLAT